MNYELYAISALIVDSETTENEQLNWSSIFTSQTTARTV